MIELLYSLQGANFRDLKGIIIKEDGMTVDVVREPRELLKSGKPLVCAHSSHIREALRVFLLLIFLLPWNHFFMLICGIWILLCRCQTML